ncbi:Uu.00g081220.m01.CDS01 [Anthostomella pinea]|uniref:Uu.00g081220.m01.CDS01 n=1 Tax=Anthostomella pinea TaxID=933095 RepID=A0AAI8VL47_9PEZI|nr:Uu.00g081220.m01.CDS01 [Anthostomella pinea]
MLSIRKRTSRGHGTSSHDDSTLSSTSEDRPADWTTGGSIRKRFNGIKGSLKNRMSARSLALQKSGSESDQGTPWPALKKTYSSMATSLRGARTSLESRISGDMTRRSVTLHCPPQPASNLDRVASHTRTVSLGSQPEALLTHDAPPRLPGLDEMVAHSRPSCEDSVSHESPNFAALDSVFDSLISPPFYTRSPELEEAIRKISVAPPPISGRLPIRLKHAEPPVVQASDNYEPEPVFSAEVLQHHHTCMPPKLPRYGHRSSMHTRRRRPAHNKNCSSRVPVEWLDLILETSQCTRSPVRLVLKPSKATVEWLDRILETSQRTRCPARLVLKPWSTPESERESERVQVLLPMGTILINDNENVPAESYDTLTDALKDVQKRCLPLVSPFAVYHQGQRTLRLYRIGQRPDFCFLETNTILIDLRKWQKSLSDYSLSHCNIWSSDEWSSDDDTSIKAQSSGSQRSTDDSDWTFSGDEEDGGAPAGVKSEDSLLQDEEDLDLASRLGCID